MAQGPRKCQRIKFPKAQAGDFYPVLRQRVDAYFSTHKLSRYGTRALWLKTAVVLSLYALTYSLLLAAIGGFAGALCLYFLLGVEAAFIGFTVIHDALHGSYSSNRHINRCIGYLFDFNAMSSYIWSISHNIYHHTYTNITGADQDIDKMVWLRLSPFDGHYWFNRYQHWYVWPLYCLSSLNWCHYSDYKQLWQEWRENRVKAADVAIFMAFKLLNWGVFFFLPLLLLNLPWWQVALGYLAMHAAGGLTSAIVFQLAHVVEGVEYPLPDATGQMSERWAEHEVRTSSNFATHNAWLSYCLGGLNFQIEHHLFPHVCHTHYPAIAPIVKATVLEFGLPYCEQPTFRQAVVAHWRALRRLGNPSVLTKNLRAQIDF